ncbi:biotin--[acetyl-CoA-carboxylase] ligase [Pisciglobus halotolerans]|uniref:Bifunctional ligase/repressor BirA n=1 Tax=Pisciglobus halotolerans TaxID=745365 RepID=A0A1I3DX61_9LACT|nr:biotin--[acetyl-CoA-carboxylase] ligase [Pisciglobus halotolerans]SFH91179.1 BirA family transcriptional regulator, biotin operon repressor / biotin-[acetyl-CoA-carboxylase] ligase [Pisciglobus halotolerans]
MKTKEKVLQYLTQHKGEVISGQEMADNLALSRTSIWKAIRSLQTEGFKVESITNKGYRLATDPDQLSKAILLPMLNEQPDVLEVYPTIGSTNDAAKALINERPIIHKGILVAEEQTKGRGRLGRQFYSPNQTGLYMSLIYQNKQAANAAALTTAAAVAVCRAIEKLTNKQPVIKWVNDLFLDGRKICGILTEGILNLETGTIDSVIVGIGLNVRHAEMVPEAFQSIIGSLFGKEETTVTRNQLAAEIINQLDVLYEALDQTDYLDEYRKRCFVLGQKVYFNEKKQNMSGIAETIDDEGGLVVKLDNGQIKTLRYGEISIKLGEKG